MRIPRLYVPGHYQPEQSVELSEEQAHYLMRVLRLRAEHPLEIFDGQGQQASARLTPISKKQASARIEALSAVDRESPLTTTLVQSVSKGDRMDYSLQKAVELGVTAIQPVLTEHSMVRLSDDKAEKRQRQWQAIVIHACEQCGRTHVPEVRPLKTYQAWLNALPADAETTNLPGLVLDPRATHTLSDLTPPAPQQPLCFLIGPEGGLSTAEIDQAVEKGLKAIALGPRVLRTETAGVALLAAMQTLWGDFAR
ncbi:MAG: 16S rRNA (uracil(1498)-N(3))-methyltransferase [Hydrogenovibrio sp.]|uniref:16S rRNA (uracil(1498)-N(3))-methyltransferase n=1 Tax=Hydrogenovibrio sp. TaxID=2065821 RepID=UPI00287071F4|nr:16S rRNA (uracil(1498)-N(3))-methyltransferase [Hydrogenovibrio sp.]MDR9498002.1 16S rRNA (uracil(1498)-N(3))-methyltransferase [Hydrogenovibrio sp.]